VLQDGRGNAIRSRTGGRILPAKDRAVAAAKFEGVGREAEYRIDGIPGLVLVVQRPKKDGGISRIWRVYYSLTRGTGRTIRKARLGPYPIIGLAEARRKAAELMEAVERGADPVGQQNAMRARAEHLTLTFEHLVTDYLTDQRAAGVKTVDEIERALRLDALPKLGLVNPASITDIQVEVVIDAVAERGRPSMARHLLAYLRGCFNHALRCSPALREKYGVRFNPADTVGRGRRGKAGKYGRPVVDDRHLSDNEIIIFCRALETSEAAESTKIVLKLLLLTGQRPSEVRCTRVAELSLGGSEPQREIPGKRTKNGDPHSVPLVRATARLFGIAAGLGHGSPFVFPSADTADGILGRYTLQQALKRLITRQGVKIEPFSPKDLRSTVKTGMARLGIPKEVRDSVQNHKPQGIGDRAYNFHQYAKEKRQALEMWTNHVAPLMGIDT
jgi:integrase